MDKINENEIRIRFATEKDAKELLDIYKPYVENTAITFEYDVPSVQEFAERICKIQKKYPYLVAEIDGEIVGYAYAGAFKVRAAYAWNVETSIYVTLDKKRLGIGRKLYDVMEKILAEQNITNLNACIAYPETEDEYLTKDSVEFHKKLGYELVGEFHKCGYKFSRWYNIIWMEKHIGVHVENQPSVKGIDEVRERVKDKYGI